MGVEIEGDREGVDSVVERVGFEVDLAVHEEEGWCLGKSALSCDFVDSFDFAVFVGGKRGSRLAVFRIREKCQGPYHVAYLGGDGEDARSTLLECTSCHHGGEEIESHLCAQI